MRMFENFSDDLIEKMRKNEAYIIGLDDGDGETTAAYYDYKTPKIERMIIGEDGTSKIITAVSIPKGGGIGLVGRSAVSSSEPNGDQLFLNFKCKPNESGQLAPVSGDSTIKPPTKKELQQRFIQGVMDSYSIKGVRARNFMENPQFPVILLIGRPAGRGWEGAVEEAYRKLLSENLTVFGKRPVATLVVSESLAALAHSVSNSDAKVGFSDGVICIDSGSSTLDATYSRGGEILFEDGIPLGAKLIEENMFKYAMDQHIKKTGVRISAKDFPERTFDMLQLRQAKERFYGTEIEPPKDRVKLLLALKKDNEDFDIKVVANADLMGHVIAQMPITINTIGGTQTYPSWYDGYKKFLTDLKGKVKDYKRVVLTGGGSNMPFLANLAREIFGADKVLLSNEPSFTVSKGLAWIAQRELEAEVAYRGLMKKLPDMLLEMPRGLSGMMAAEIAPLLLDEAFITTLELWKNSETYYPTLNDAAKAINWRCETLLNSDRCKSKVIAATKEWLQGSLPHLVANVNACISEGLNTTIPPQFQVKLPSDVCQSLANTVGSIKIDVNAEEFLNKVMGFLGWGFVDFTSVRSMSARKGLHDNFMAKYRQGSLLTGFGSASGMRYTVESKIAAQSGTIYQNIFGVRIDEVVKCVSEQISTMALYVYSGR